jgi:hypothetical protein
MAVTCNSWCGARESWETACEREAPQTKTVGLCAVRAAAGRVDGVAAFGAADRARRA